MKSFIALLLICAQIWLPTYAAAERGSFGANQQQSNANRGQFSTDQGQLGADQGQFHLPQIGNQATAAISQQQLHKLGEKILVNLYNHNAILEDPLVTDYLQSIGHKLSSHSDRPDLHFTYFAVNTSAINAFALPGGFIGINNGLFTATSTENELAGVMAHETSHVTQRHIVRKIAGSGATQLAGLAALIGSVLLGVLTHNPDIIQGGIMGSEAALIQHQINFTRSQEEEADRVGINLMARAGFNPSGMANFFKYMEQQANIMDASYPPWLNNHPTDPHRIAEVYNRARQFHVPPHKSSRDYFLMRARVRTLASSDPHELLAYFKHTHAHVKGEEARATAYGEALSYMQLGQAQAALKIMRRLLKQGEDQIPYHIGVAEAQIAAGDIKAGMKTYRTAMQLFPDSRPLTLSYARSLLTTGHPRQSRSLLITLNSDATFDPTEVHLLARASAATGDIAQGHYYLSDYYFMTGDVREAIEQIKIAMQMPSTNQFQKTRYQTKLANLKQIYKHMSQQDRERQQGRRYAGSD